VLLAEDIVAYLDRIRALFDHLDIEFIAALDGQEAIDHILDETCHIDLLVTDLDMPRRTGWDVINTLRELRGDSIPIIMQTGEAAYPWVKEQAAALDVLLIDKIHVDIRLVGAVCEALRISTGDSVS
jgi:CheY-like chemotaxis protein